MHLWAAFSTLQHSNQSLLIILFCFFFFKGGGGGGGVTTFTNNAVFLQHEAEMRSDAIKSATGFLSNVAVCLTLQAGGAMIEKHHQARFYTHTYIYIVIYMTSTAVCALVYIICPHRCARTRNTMRRVSSIDTLKRPK